jgi:hypothetical protein
LMERHRTNPVSRTMRRSSPHRVRPRIRPRRATRRCARPARAGSGISA